MPDPTPPALPPGAAAVPVERRPPDPKRGATDAVAVEGSLLLRAGGRPLCRLQCTPLMPRELALGFLLTSGLIAPDAPPPPLAVSGAAPDLVVDAALALDEGQVEAFRAGLSVGTGCGQGAFTTRGWDPLDCRRRLDLDYRLEPGRLAEGMRRFQRRSVLFQTTGGTHSAGLMDPAGRLELFAEDIGRHNAVDKVVGLARREGRALESLALLVTGRLSLDLAAKAVRAGVPLAASRAAPTDQAVALARLARLTLVGFVRGERMNVYCEEWRLQVP